MHSPIALQKKRANTHLPGIPGVLSKEEEAWVEPEEVDEGLEAARTVRDSARMSIGTDDVWLEPEKIDEGLKKTQTTRDGCNDLCVCNIWRPACRSLKHEIGAGDAPFIPEPLSAGFQVSRIEQAWDQELDPHFRSNHCCCRSKPSLIRAVFSVSGNYVFLGNLFGMVYGVALGLFRPLLIKFLVEELGSPKPDLTTMFILIGLLSASNLVEAFMGTLMFRFLKDRFACSLLMMLGNLVQRKGLRIKDGVTSTTPSGLIGNDVVRVHRSLNMLSWSMFSFAAMVASIITLILTIGWVSAIALAAFVILCTTNTILGHLSRKQAHDALEKADKRLGVMTEIIDGIKAIKLCAWESKFLEHITAVREAETVPIGKQRVLGDIPANVGRSAPQFIAMVCFLCLALVVPNSPMIRAGPMFAAMNVFLALRNPLIMLPETVVGLQHMGVSFDRLTEFLLLPEFKPPPVVGPGSRRVREGDVVVRIPGTSRFKWRLLDPHHAEDQKSGEVTGGIKNLKPKEKKTSGAKPSRSSSKVHPVDPHHAEDQKSGEVTGGIKNLKSKEKKASGAKPNRSSSKVHPVDPHHAEDRKSGEVTGGIKNLESEEKKASGAKPNRSSSKVHPVEDHTTLRSFRISMPKDDICIQHGERVAVVGAVGSGKTSLLMAVVGHLDRQDGDRDSEARCIEPRVHTGYVPQTPFIVRGSIRLNIHMGRGVEAAGHQSRFDNAVTGAGLDPDLREIHDGVDAEVGKETLSGGQKQRVTIARALYSRSELLVLDDPLSAVDGTSAQTILNALMERPNTTVLMAMNQVRLVHRFDRVLIVDSGRVVADLPPAKVQACLDRGELDALSESGRELVAELAKASAAATAIGLKAEDKCTSKQNDAIAGPTTKTRAIRHRKTLVGEDLIDLTGVEALAVADKDRGGTLKTMLAYINGMGSGLFSFVMLLTFISLCGMGAADRLLAYWMEWVEGEVSSHELAVRTAGANVSVSALSLDHTFYVSIYSGLALLYVLGMLLNAVIFMVGGVRGSKALHFRCLNTLMHAPVSWFNATPSGRIISRFSSDISIVDLYLPRYIDWTSQFGSTVLVVGIVLVLVIPLMLPELLVCFVLFGVLTAASVPLSQGAKRAANTAMSPVQSTLLEIEQGRVLIRTMRLESFFTTRFMCAMDRLQRATYFSDSVLTWVSLAASLIALALSIPTAFIVVLMNGAASEQSNIGYAKNSTDNTINNADAGLALTYALNTPYFLIAFVYVLTEVMVMLTSLERLLKYADTKTVPQEPAWSSPNDPKDEWPSKGAIVFENASLVYRPGLPPALKQVSLRIEGGERLGVVGPSGAGKSSLLVLLFRLMDPSAGRVLIDGIDIKNLGLLTLRQAMAIIPQTPLLLGASVRKNLDPFDQHSTDVLQDVLRAVGLSPLLLDNNDQKLTDTKDAASKGRKKEESEEQALATSLSAGEKQMLNLARAMLLPNIRILVCDEPTSNVDMATDRRLQQIIRTHFPNRTIITIAHRLDTVVDNDNIVVMNAGSVAEIGPPLELLQREGSMLRQLGISAGNLDHLIQRAAGESYTAT